MINLSSIFEEANNQPEKQRDVLVMVEDSTLFAEKTTEVDWGNNTSESDVDYDAYLGSVILLGSMWVCDDTTNKIYNIKSDGTLISSFLTSVIQPAVTGISGVTRATNGTLWGCDKDWDRVFNMSTTGTFISSFTLGSNLFPTGVHYASDDTLWVCEQNLGNGRIINYSTAGVEIDSFDTGDTFGGNFPTGICEAPDGNLWVCNATTVYNIETDGTLIYSFTAPGTATQGVGITPDNKLWLVDWGADRVYFLESSGVVIKSFPTSVFDVSTNSTSGIDFHEYLATGDITTDNIDLGEVPTAAGEWVINDIIPSGSSITYAAWYSTTGAFGGEEVSIGAIVDGDSITDLKRYWRVEATLTSDGSVTPILQSIKADFSTYRRFNKIPDLGYEPLVTKVTSLTSKVDFFKPASIGQISVGIQMTDAVSDWVYNATLYNKIVQVKLGFKYDGFTEANYIHYFTGAIDDWSLDNNKVLNLKLKDLSKDWKLPVPSKWEAGGDDITWTNEHHTDVMLDIFQNHINVRDSGLLLEFFATVKAATSGYQVTRTITGRTEDAKKLVEELRVLLFAFFLPRGDGKIGIKQFDSSEAIVATFTDDNTMSIKWKANAKDLINKTALYFDWDGDGDNESDYAEYDEGNDTTSQTKFQVIKPYTLKDKWTDIVEASQISALETKILDQFDDMPSKVTINCDAKDIAYEAGDMVNVTTTEAPGSGGGGVTDEKYLIISKNLDFLGDKIIFEGLKVAL